MPSLSSPAFAMLKRLLSFLIGLAVLAFNNKLGLGLSGEAQMAITALILGYVAQSSIKESALKKAEMAAAKVVDVASAVAELRKGAAP